MSSTAYYNWPACLAIVAALLAFGIGERTAVAGDGEVELRLVIPPESIEADSVSKVFDVEALDEIAREAAQRVRVRLEAAEVEKASVTRENTNQIVIRAHTDLDKDELGTIVVPAGRATVRPVLELGRTWTKQAAALPEGVEIRQSDTSMDADSAYIWSRSRGALERALRVADLEVELGEIELAVYPASGGWRSVAMGPPAVTHNDVVGVGLRHGGSGRFFVQLRLERSIVAPSAGTQIDHWALELDGEVVSIFATGGDQHTGSLQLTPPEHLKGKTARYRWARQVAGRLAAYIPVPLVPIESVE